MAPFSHMTPSLPHTALGGSNKRAAAGAEPSANDTSSKPAPDRPAHDRAICSPNGRAVTFTDGHTHTASIDASFAFAIASTDNPASLAAPYRATAGVYVGRRDWVLE